MCVCVNESSSGKWIIYPSKKLCVHLKEDVTFNMPSRLTSFAEINVAPTPINAHNPLKLPIIDGFKPETTPAKCLEILDELLN